MHSLLLLEVPVVSPLHGLNAADKHASSVAVEQDASCESHCYNNGQNKKDGSAIIAETAIFRRQVWHGRDKNEE